MALNFPDNPSNGDTYSFGGKTYTYNSTKSSWSPSIDLLVPTYATVNDLPSSGSAGSQAFVTATNRLYLWNGSGWYNIALLNTTPTISGVSSSYDLAIDGTATVITITAVDAEGLPITYSIASDTSGNIATVTQGTGASSNVFTVTPSTNSANAGTFSLTFRASDGVNIASSIASFTLQFSVENSNYTTALITSVGANNAVNNTFDDKSSNDYSMTVNGNTNQTTFSPYRHGGYSTLVGVADGTDFLSAAQDTSLNGLFSGDFTIEFWFNKLTNRTQNYILSKGGGTTREWGIAVQSNSVIVYWSTQGTSGGDTSKTFSATIGLNEWHHLAVTFDQSTSTITAYLDGTSLGTNTFTSIYGGNGTLYVGRFMDYTAISHSCHAYITDLRIVKGSTVYSSAFTPPTARLTAVTNTSLLTCHLPYIADGSTNDHTITIAGNTSTQPFSPYDYLSYNDDNNGGSVYLDGSGDYLSTTLTTPVGSSDYQAELWAYVHSNSTWAGLMACRTGDTSADWLFGINRSLAYGVYLYVGSHLFNSGNTHIPLKQWVHLVLTREGNNGKIFMNGKQIASTTSYTASTYNHTNTAFTIGAGRSNGTETIHANIADARLKVGSGSVTYTSDFTPPTSPSTTTADSQVHVKSTNAGIIDKAQRAENMILYGNTNSSTSQTKYLASSIYLDGTSDYIDLYSSGIANFGTGDFTIELWAYYNSIPGYVYLLETRNGTNSTTNCWSLSHNWMNNTTNDRLQFAATAVGDLLTANTAMPTGQWVHIAVARNGTSLKMFFDGVEVASATNSYDFNQNQIPIRVGARFSTEFFFDGYISDIRITKGLARYTVNFTPPTAELKG
jgi:hypothetical protein